MNIHLVQHDIVWEDPAKTIAGIREILAGADVHVGDLIVLPEMFSTGFSMNSRATIEPENGPAGTFLRHLAVDRAAWVIGGLVSGAECPRNQAVGFKPDGSPWFCYSKRRTFSLAGESEVYARGDAAVVVDGADLRIAPMVCYDLRFPELFRECARAGAEMFVVIANWPEPRIDHWISLLKARAIENQAVVAGINRVGVDPTASYPGRSAVFSPEGQCLLDAGHRPGVFSTPVDADSVRHYRQSFPALRDAGFT